MHKYCIQMVLETNVCLPGLCDFHRLLSVFLCWGRITKSHSLCDVSDTSLLSHSPEAGRSRSRCGQGPFLRGLPPRSAGGCLPCPPWPTWSSLCVCLCPDLLSWGPRTLGPPWSTSCHLQELFEDPPPTTVTFCAVRGRTASYRIEGTSCPPTPSSVFLALSMLLPQQ